MDSITSDGERKCRIIPLTGANVNEGVPLPMTGIVVSLGQPSGRKQPSRSWGTKTPPISCRARSGSLNFA